jgi:hypothetical protein
MGVSGLPMTAWAFETVGVTPSKVKGSAVKSNAVPMRSFLMEVLLHHCAPNLLSRREFYDTRRALD